MGTTGLTRVVDDGELPISLLNLELCSSRLDA